MGVLLVALVRRVPPVPGPGSAGESPAAASASEAVVAPVAPASPEAAAPRLEASPVEGPPPAEVLAALRPRVPRSEAELLGILRDPAQPLKARRDAGRVLAGSSSPEALAAVREALASGPPYLQAAIAEGLGQSAAPEAKERLRSLLRHPDEVVARGAIRGWANAGSVEGVQVMTDVLYGGDWPESVRGEAALGLGEATDRPEARVALTNAAWHLRDGDLAPLVLEGLGHHPIDTTSAFFREYLATPGLPSELRVAAVEAMGQASGEVTPLLLEYVQDPDPEVRAGAAWALSTAEESGMAGALLLEFLRNEPEGEVRQRLYQALGNQVDYDAGAVIPLLATETDREVRLAGLNLLAQACQTSPDPAMTDYFDRVAVPELRETALNGGTRQDSLASVMALERSGTPAARMALEDIARLSSDPRVVAAAGREPSPSP